MKIALLCGGPSPERGISLNSARSVLDHLGSEIFEIVPIYFDYKKSAYLISKAQLYSNTPSDFDFKLKTQAKELNNKVLLKILRNADIVFPVIHGIFGEDGQIQEFLEQNNLPFIGSGSKTCKSIFDKYKANKFIKSIGLFTQPCELFELTNKNYKLKIERFFDKYNLTHAIVKPAIGGSSIGVFSVGSVLDALEKIKLLLSKNSWSRAVIEPFCTGIEFTVIVLENDGLPAAILPTEIETDYSEHQIFDYRKKYLPSRQVSYHCPPRFSNQIIEKIQNEAEKIFTAGNFRDFARFDGWILPDGNIWFSDLNPVSGMEQNSFLFQQASRIGMSHSELLNFILKKSCKRQGIKFPEKVKNKNMRKKPVNIIFGGFTSERQVSLMSGTNVWLKLRNSKKYDPRPFLLDTKGNVWQLPYSLILNHTVEEITVHAQNAPVEQKRLELLEKKVRLRLNLKSDEANEKFFLPKKVTLKQFLDNSPYVFIALHGGIGEDGTIQKILEKNNIKFNGSNSEVLRLCINKWDTVNRIRELNIKGISAAPSKAMPRKVLISMSESEIKLLWNKLLYDFGGDSLIIKPVDDGCSTGVTHLYSEKELGVYLDLVKAQAKYIPVQTFKNQFVQIEMPIKPVNNYLIEKFIETDSIKISENSLKIKKKSNWAEITIGVIGEEGKVMSMNPSITVAEGEVLSLEEKFQGGTGVNITPPSVELMKPDSVQKVKDSITKLANSLGLRGYGRIDAFVNLENGDLIIIEINTLPGLTPSTVIFHQALAEEPQLYPKEFLEKIIEKSGY